MTWFLLIFLFTNVLAALALAGVLAACDREKRYSAAEWMISSLGLAPAGVVLLLYYSLLLAPGYYAHIHVILVAGCVGVAAWMGRFGLARIWRACELSVRAGREQWRHLPAVTRVARAASTVVVLLLAAWLASSYVRNVLPRPIMGSDILEYGTIGNVFADQYSVEYIFQRFYPETGFVFMSLHAPAFPLFLTWEKLSGGLFGCDSDWYFKSISPWYALLILALAAYWLSRLSRWLALLGMLALLASIGFFLSFVEWHLDSFRILLLLLSWVWLAHVVRNNDRIAWLMLGMCSGLAAFAHSIGAIAAGVNCVTVFLFAPGPWTRKIVRLAGLVGLILLFGGLHYVIDTIWGRGWVWNQ